MRNHRTIGAIAAVSLALAACGADPIDRADGIEDVATRAGDADVDGTASPGDTAPDDSLPSSDGTGDVPGGQNAPAVAEFDCETFPDLTAVNRMFLLEQLDEPPDTSANPDCERAVAVTRRAIEVRDTGEAIYNDYGLYADGMLAEQDCADGTATGTIENVSDVPLVYWGATLALDEDSMVVGFEPYITEVVEPGDTVEVSADADGADCYIEVRPTVAAAGELSTDGTFGPAPSDDPQSSDDVDEWMAALNRNENIATRIGSLEHHIEYVEDLHSMDVYDLAPSFTEFGFGDPEEVDDPVNERVVCDTLLEKTPTGTDGEMQAVLFATVFEGEQSAAALSMGVFRRGDDGRWRWMGRAISLTAGGPADDPCEFPTGPDGPTA